MRLFKSSSLQPRVRVSNQTEIRHKAKRLCTADLFRPQGWTHTKTLVGMSLCAMEIRFLFAVIKGPKPVPARWRLSAQSKVYKEMAGMGTLDSTAQSLDL